MQSIYLLIVDVSKTIHWINAVKVNKTLVFALCNAFISLFYITCIVQCLFALVGLNQCRLSVLLDLTLGTVATAAPRPTGSRGPAPPARSTAAGRARASPPRPAAAATPGAG